MIRRPNQSGNLFDARVCRHGLMLAVLVALLASCASRRPYVWASDVPVTERTRDPAVRAGDELYVLVRGQPDATGDLRVRADGSVVHGLAGKVAVAGLSTDQAAAAIRRALTPALSNPSVTVAVTSTRPWSVSVLGEVQRGGRYELARGEGVLEAIARAGGLTEFADSTAIFVIRRDEPPRRVRFRYDALTGGEPSSLAFELRDGDVVFVE